MTLSDAEKHKTGQKKISHPVNQGWALIQDITGVTARLASHSHITPIRGRN